MDTKQTLDILRQTIECNNEMIGDAREKQLFHDAFETAVEAVEKVIKMSWIPTTEILPKAHDIVLVTYQSKDGKCGTTTHATYVPLKTILSSNFFADNPKEEVEYDETADCYWVKEAWYEVYTDDDWEYYGLSLKDYDVTAWMPKMEPYQGGEE